MKLIWIVLAALFVSIIALAALSSAQPLAPRVECVDDATRVVVLSLRAIDRWRYDARVELPNHAFFATCDVRLW